ncbi:unnamed protein product [Rodentolepis nana]|uniref:FHA domain-containing protein n=1 Tax=Rodentolepis nana TaxID=102285 RepID=A0A0R3TVV9_RODNA|nr:unnamed protein product [Rodentolepis nana]
MSIFRLHYIGNLALDPRFPDTILSKVPDIYRPKVIEFPKDRDEIKIGRVDSDSLNDFNLESCIYRPLITPHHASIKRTQEGEYELHDYSLNGTFVNYIRVGEAVTLKRNDIICFGCYDSFGKKPGEKVTNFPWDQKYVVYLGPPEDDPFMKPENNFS